MEDIRYVRVSAARMIGKRVAIVIEDKRMEETYVIGSSIICVEFVLL